jgi:hypothetical protein
MDIVCHAPSVISMSRWSSKPVQLRLVAEFDQRSCNRHGFEAIWRALPHARLHAIGLIRWERTAVSRHLAGTIVTAPPSQELKEAIDLIVMWVQREIATIACTPSSPSVDVLSIPEPIRMRVDQMRVSDLAHPSSRSVTRLGKRLERSGECR